MQTTVLPQVAFLSEAESLENVDRRVVPVDHAWENLVQAPVVERVLQGEFRGRRGVAVAPLLGNDPGGQRRTVGGMGYVGYPD